MKLLLLLSLFLQTAQAEVQVAILHSDGTPVSGLRLSLVLFEYAESIIPIPAGTCTTDAAGECAFTVSDPPQTDGWTEGYLYIQGLDAPQYLGWYGETYTVTLTLLPDGTLPTREPPLHGDFEGQDAWETPTAPAPPLSAPAVTISPSPSPSSYPSSPLPAETNTPAALPSATPAPAAAPGGRGFPAWATWGVLALSILAFLWSTRNRSE